MNGAFLIHKTTGISSFGIIEKIQRHLCEMRGVKKRDLPKMGHGGTLDPFASGLLIILVGKGVKLARYFLGSRKTYEGTIHFGQTTLPGDPTEEFSETSTVLPSSLKEIQAAAHQFTLQPYLQTPPMHSAVKQNGKPLYELARAGIEVERKVRTLQLYRFDIFDYENACSRFRLESSSGTYVRTLSQDLGKQLGTVAMLDCLHRSACGSFSIDSAIPFEKLLELDSSTWENLPCFVPFSELLGGYFCAEATQKERLALFQGRQNVLFDLLQKVTPPKKDPHQMQEDPDCVAIYCEQELIAIARKENDRWGIERVFVTE